VAELPTFCNIFPCAPAQQLHPHLLHVSVQFATNNVQRKEKKFLMFIHLSGNPSTRKYAGLQVHEGGARLQNCYPIKSEISQLGLTANQRPPPFQPQPEGALTML
jgi:hypothetical protein